MKHDITQDQELWKRIKDNDTRAFEYFYNSHWQALYKTARRYIKDQQTCEEVVHNVFLTLWRCRENLHIENFVKYLNAATRYEVYRRLRQGRNNPIDYVDNYTNTSSSFTQNEGQQRLEQADLFKTLESCMRNLPKRCLMIFRLSRFEHLSNDEIAQQLGISKHTVENQLSDALKILKGILKF